MLSQKKIMFRGPFAVRFLVLHINSTAFRSWESGTLNNFQYLTKAGAMGRKKAWYVLKRKWAFLPLKENPHSARIEAGRPFATERKKKCHNRAKCKPSSGSFRVQ